MIVPPTVKRGDTVRVVAPSGPFDQSLFWRGISVLHERYRVRFRDDIRARQGFLAGPDARRLAELREALADPDASAIVSARGGYGLTRLLPALSPSELRARPKWFVGFSDATALHLAYSKAGVMSLHAPNVTGLGRADAQTHSEFFEYLESPLNRRTLSGAGAAPGRACGQLVGGNLSLLQVASASRSLRLPAGSILAMEDVAEGSYCLDRMLEALIGSGALDVVAGFAIGELTDCSAGRFNVHPKAVLIAQLRRLRVPIVTDLPFGHGRNNCPLTLGAPAELDGETGTDRKSVV